MPVSTRNAVLLALFFTLASTSLYPKEGDGGQPLFLGLAGVYGLTPGPGGDTISLAGQVSGASGAVSPRTSLSLRVHDRLRAELTALAHHDGGRERLAIRTPDSANDMRNTKSKAAES